MKGRDGRKGKEKNKVNMGRPMDILWLGCLELREAEYMLTWDVMPFWMGTLPMSLINLLRQSNQWRQMRNWRTDRTPVHSLNMHPCKTWKLDLEKPSFWICILFRHWYWGYLAQKYPGIGCAKQMGWSDQICYPSGCGDNAWQVWGWITLVVSQVGHPLRHGTFVRLAMSDLFFGEILTQQLAGCIIQISLPVDMGHVKWMVWTAQSKSTHFLVAESRMAVAYDPCYVVTDVAAPILHFSVMWNLLHKN